VKNLRERIALRLCPWLKPEPSSTYSVYAGEFRPGGIIASSSSKVRLKSGSRIVLKATGFGC
jgi:hypothetical protein